MWKRESQDLGKCYTGFTLHDLHTHSQMHSIKGPETLPSLKKWEINWWEEDMHLRKSLWMFPSVGHVWLQRRQPLRWASGFHWRWEDLRIAEDKQHLGTKYDVGIFALKGSRCVQAIRCLSRQRCPRNKVDSQPNRVLLDIYNSKSSKLGR